MIFFALSFSFVYFKAFSQSNKNTPKTKSEILLDFAIDYLIGNALQNKILSFQQ